MHFSIPKVKTSTQTKIETITPTPTSENSNDKHKVTRYSTTTTTVTLYYAGYSSTITTTDSKGRLKTYATYIPPSTVLVVKEVAVTAPALEDDGTSNSVTILHDFHGHGLWGITMSLTIIVITLSFMIFV